MKKIYIIITLGLFSFNGLFGQIKLGDNVNTINTSSLLELESTTKGLLFSRMTTTQMNALTFVNGLTIYNLDSNCLFTYNGTQWTNLCAITTIPNLILTKIGTGVSLKLGSGNTVYFSVADNDSSKTNEIQTISFANDTIFLSLNGGKVGLKSLIIDTTSLSNRINQRVKYTDTAAMLAPYLREADTSSLSNRINKKLAAADTISLSNRIDKRVKYTDTAAMLAPYLREVDTASLSNRINKKLAAADTISLSNRIDKRVKYTDTAAMLAPYLRDADTASLSNRINTNKQAIIDTATSLRNKINAHIAADLDIDTTNEMQTLSISGQTLRISKRNSVTLPNTDTTSLSNRINQRVKYSDTASMLTPYLRKGDTTNMLSKYIYNANNGLTKSGKTAQLGGSLIQATTITSTITNTLAIAGLISGNKTNDSILVSVASTGVLKRISPVNLLNGYLRFSDTLNLSNRINQRVKYSDTATMLFPYIRKGNQISGTPGSIFYAGANRRPTSNNTELFWDTVNLRLGIGTNTPTHKLQVNGQVRATSFANADGTASAPSYRFNNDANTGIYLRAADDIAISTNGLEALRVDPSGNIGIGAIAPTQKMDINGRLRVRSISVNNAIDTILVVDANGLIQKKYLLALNISDTASMLSKYIFNANNGLTKSGKNAQLGGSLIQATTITTTGTNTLAIAGLTSGNKTNDSILVSVASSGVLKRISPASLTTGFMKYTDTASMLSKYLRKGDTTAMLSKYIFFANNGLTKSGKTAQLGGSLIQATTISTTGTNTLAIAGLTSGNKTNDSILVSVASSGVLKRISPASLTTGFMKYTDTASMLSKYLRKGDTTAMLSKYIFFANNGLTKSGKTAQLGGSLIQATTISTTGTNTLSIAGLQSALSTDSLVMMTSSGVLKKKSNYANVLAKTTSYTITTSDHGAVITVNSSSATTITIPSGLPVGFNISIYQIGTGRVTLAGASGVTLKNRLSRFRLAGKDAAAGIVITASNIAHISGDLSK